MRRKPLLWKLFPAYFAIALVSVLLVAMYASQALRDFYYEQIETDLTVRAEMVREEILRLPDQSDIARLRKVISQQAASAHTRLTLIRADGVVLADSETNPAKMENHSDRPEFIQAMKGRVGTSRRVSPTLGYTMVYAAIPIKSSGRITGVLRAALAATALDAAPSVVYRRMITGAVLMGLFAAIASLLAVRTISRPLMRLKQAAERFANGDFRSRVPNSDTEEFANLGDTLNRMAAQLDRQVQTITRQSGEQQAILSSMREAVIAIDNDERVLILNPAAERMLGISLYFVKGKTIQEAIRNPDLQRFFEKIHEGEIPPSDEIIFRGAEERIVQAMGCALMDAEGKNLGVLVVLNDVTQTRRLETMRKDFVANVSHELKTPITSIKGFVETLRDGSVEDENQARDFLDIVARQADRLNAIIEDLLVLSSIEQRTETADMSLEPAPIKDVLQAAVMNCRPKAMDSGSQVMVECPEDLAASINAPLLEQALTNLVDNAIKYSSGGDVWVRAGREGDEVAIHVIDTGTGIGAEHIPRLFERFYRVDKARSRKQGGTGLGLAIVKHIVQAHHGRIEVRSMPGAGSTFSIYLPGENGQL